MKVTLTDEGIPAYLDLSNKEALILARDLMHFLATGVPPHVFLAFVDARTKKHGQLDFASDPDLTGSKGLHLLFRDSEST